MPTAMTAPLRERPAISTCRQPEQDLLRLQNDRLLLLAQAAEHLLSTDDPQAQIQGLYERVAQHLGVDTYFNFMVNEAGDALHLDCCGGVPQEIIPALQRLEFGQAICGTVALERHSIVACHIQTSDYEKANLVRGMGIRAYCCHPLMMGDRLLGTLSFASHTRDQFDAGEVEFMRTICHYVSMAKVRRLRENEIAGLNARLTRAMQETHHRVKNSLQLVAALVDMLALEDGETVRKSEVAGLGAKVRALAAVHDLLTCEARANDAATVSTRDVLQELLPLTRSTLVGREIEADLDDARISAQRAAGLALVANEILTNAAKHGAGRIGVTFRVPNSHAVLEVVDDGPGFPPNVEAILSEHTGLGLVQHLVRWDLGGTLRLANRPEGGGRVTVTLSLCEPVA